MTTQQSPIHGRGQAVFLDLGVLSGLARFPLSPERQLAIGGTLQSLYGEISKMDRAFVTSLVHGSGEEE